MGAVAAVAVAAQLLALCQCTTFLEFVETYDKHYQSLQEYEYRKKVFEANAEMVREKNAVNSSGYVLGINEHSDLTEEEFIGTA